MPYTHITAAHNGADSLAYALGNGKGHNGKEERNQIVSGINLLDNDSISYADQMEIFWAKADKRVKTQTYRIVQSFSREELNPDNPDDIMRAHEIARKTAKRLYPDHQAGIFTQIDGESGLIHNHIIESNIDMQTHKALKNSDVHYRRIEYETDEIAKDYVHTKEQKTFEQSGEKVNQTVRAKREKNKKLIAEGKEPEYIWQDDLRERIKKASVASSSFEEFEQALLENGVGMVRHDPPKSKNTKAPNGYITYELKDTSGFKGKVPKNLKSKSYKLGFDYDIYVLEKTFALNADIKNTKTERTITEETTAQISPQEEEQEPVHEVRLGSREEENTGVELQNEVQGVPYEEAQKQAEELFKTLFLARHEDEDPDEAWNDFRQWRTDRRSRTGHIGKLYDKDKETKLVTVMDDNLKMQFRQYDSQRMKEQAEKDAERLAKRLALTESVLPDFTTSETPEKEDQEKH